VLHEIQLKWWHVVRREGGFGTFELILDLENRGFAIDEDTRDYAQNEMNFDVWLEPSQVCKSNRLSNRLLKRKE
jgi:hypothetical protein